MLCIFHFFVKRVQLHVQQLGIQIWKFPTEEYRIMSEMSQTEIF
jgi:hypothetical protein